jgi:hypothetical protein
MMSKILKVCYDKILPQDLRAGSLARALHSHESSGAEEAVMPIKKQWPNGTTLGVRFMGGDSSHQALVKKFAPQWSKHANVKLHFNDAPDAQIRITFLDDGAWSYVGTDCLGIPLHAATMNLGWVDEGVILHEFGHAIGLGHEHQNPKGGIEWNEEQVIRDLSGPPNYWDPATIRHNVIEKYSEDHIKGTDYDDESIMLYAFPASWTLNGVATSANEVLSGMDKKFIGSAEAYPFDTGGPVELKVAEAKATAAEIRNPGEEDLFKFRATAAGRYTIETEGPTDVVMSLFGPDSQTRRIAQDDDSGAAWNAKIVADLVLGDYFVQVRHYNTARGTGSYGIKVSR